MRYGFTGTQRGSTGPQRAAFTEFLRGAVGSLRHGDCIGWDAEAHDIAEASGLLVYISPPTNPRKRAFKSAAPHLIAEPRPYLVRNRIIVESCDTLLATPGERREQLRSGTWATMRHARRLRRPIVAFYPDGSVKAYDFSSPKA